MEWGFLLSFLALLGGLWAHIRKGRNFWLWALYTFLLPPVALIHLFTLPDRTDLPAQRRRDFLKIIFPLFFIVLPGNFLFYVFVFSFSTR